MGIVEFWAQHWFAGLQSLGIIAGLCFTGAAWRQDATTRRVTALISLTEQHRSIWLKVCEQQDLLRVLDASPNLEQSPVTESERVFVNLVFLHLSSVLQAVETKTIRKPDGMDHDIEEFLSRPIPQQVWQDTLPLRDHRVVSYVQSLSGHTATPHHPLAG